jgi:hypothetical protein
MNTKQVSVQSGETGFGALQAGIALLTLATAIIHITLLFPDVLFILNGLGYLVLLALYFLPIQFARANHNLIRWVFIGYTAVTIVLWAVMNFPDHYNVLGFVTKAIEAVLIILLLADRRTN